MRSLKVLVVEQRPARLLQLHQMLNACGVYHVRIAEDARAARDNLARQGRPDLIVLGGQGTPAKGLIDEFPPGTRASAVIVQGQVGCPVTTTTVRRARHAGLWVLGLLPSGEQTHRLHAMLQRLATEYAEPLIA